jgi:hypothetical protein
MRVCMYAYMHICIYIFILDEKLFLFYNYITYFQGDIWAESRVMGLIWHYYACMEGAVYDVTYWAACQAGNLKHLKANTHTVQYRIVLGQRPPPHTSSSSKKKQSDSNTRYL